MSPDAHKPATTAPRMRKRVAEGNTLGQRTDAEAWQAVYLVLSIGFGLLFLGTLHSGPNVNVAVKLIFLAVLVLTFKRWTGALLLAIVQLNLFYLEQPYFVPMSSVVGLVWIALTLGLVASVSRYRTLHDYLPRTKGAGGVAKDTSAGSDTLRRELPSRMAQCLPFMQGTLLRTILILASCTLAAFLVMQMLPLVYTEPGFDPVRELQLKPSGYRTLASGLILFLCFLAVWLIINEICWRSMTPAQASVYLRSVFLKWIHRDLRMVVKRRIKQRRVRVRRSQPPEPPPAEPSTEGDL